MLENLDGGVDRIANDEHAGPGVRGGEGECCNPRGIVEQGLQLHRNYLAESRTACGFQTFAAVFRPRNEGYGKAIACRRSGGCSPRRVGVPGAVSNAARAEAPSVAERRSACPPIA